MSSPYIIDYLTAVFICTVDFKEHYLLHGLVYSECARGDLRHVRGVQLKL